MKKPQPKYLGIDGNDHIVAFTTEEDAGRWQMASHGRTIWHVHKLEVTGPLAGEMVPARIVLQPEVACSEGASL